MQALAEFTKVILDMASAADGGHLEAQITALRAKARDLSELLKNNPLKSDTEVATQSKPITDELRREYAETLIQLERAMLHKQIAVTPDPTQLCNRLHALSLCPPPPGGTSATPPGGTSCPGVVPYSKPVLQPRLNLNLVPVYVNPPG